MIKKLSLLGLCGISLMGLAGCGLTTQTETQVEDVAVDSVATQEESDKVYYLSYDGWAKCSLLFSFENQFKSFLKADKI